MEWEGHKRHSFAFISQRASCLDKTHPGIERFSFLVITALPEMMEIECQAKRAGLCASSTQLWKSEFVYSR